MRKTEEAGEVDRERAQAEGRVLVELGPKPKEKKRRCAVVKKSGKECEGAMEREEAGRVDSIGGREGTSTKMCASGLMPKERKG